MKISFFTVTGILLLGALLFNAATAIAGISSALPEEVPGMYWHGHKCADDKTKTYEQCDSSGAYESCTEFGKLRNNNCPPPA